MNDYKDALRMSLRALAGTSEKFASLGCGSLIEEVHAPHGKTTASAEQRSVPSFATF